MVSTRIKHFPLRTNLGLKNIMFAGYPTIYKIKLIDMVIIRAVAIVHFKI